MSKSKATKLIMFLTACAMAGACFGPELVPERMGEISTGDRLMLGYFGFLLGGAIWCIFDTEEVK